MTVDKTGALFDKMMREYEQDVAENDHQQLSKLEKLTIRCFFDFIEERGYLR